MIKTLFSLSHTDKHFDTILQIMENKQKGKTETLCDTVENPWAFQNLVLHEGVCICLISYLDSESLIQNENRHFASQDPHSLSKEPIK